MILLSKLFKSFILLSHLMRVEAMLYSRSSSNDYSSDYNQKRSYLRSQEDTPTQREIIDELFSSLQLNIYEDDECESVFLTCEKGIVKKVEVKHYSKFGQRMMQKNKAKYHTALDYSQIWKKSSLTAYQT